MLLSRWVLTAALTACLAAVGLTAILAFRESATDATQASARTAAATERLHFALARAVRGEAEALLAPAGATEPVPPTAAASAVHTLSATDSASADRRLVGRIRVRSLRLIAVLGRISADVRAGRLDAARTLEATVALPLHGDLDRLTTGLINRAESRRNAVQEQLDDDQMMVAFLLVALGAGGFAFARWVWLTHRKDVSALELQSALTQQAGEHLDEQQRFYRTLVAQLPVATFITDPDGVVTSCSAQVEQILGVPAAEIVGTDVIKRMHFAADAQSYEPIRQLYAGEVDEYDTNITFRRAGDGASRAVHKLGRVIKSSSGERVGVQVVMIDITERQEQAQRLAEQRERSREALAALVSIAESEQARIATELHDDIVQVITAAVLKMQMGSETATSGDVVEMLTGALERTRHMMFELRPQILMQAGLPAAVRALAEHGPWRRSEVEIAVPRLSPQTEALAYRTIRELVVNARKHSQAETLTIRGHLDGSALQFVVSDDGVGFDPAVALDREAQRLHLGLQTVVERVSLAAGSLTVEAAPGKGATFIMTLPIFATGAPPAVDAERAQEGVS